MPYDRTVSASSGESGRAPEPTPSRNAFNRLKAWSATATTGSRPESTNFPDRVALVIAESCARGEIPRQLGRMAAVGHREE
jgi:hypothetical protein